MSYFFFISLPFFLMLSQLIKPEAKNFTSKDIVNEYKNFFKVEKSGEHITIDIVDSLSTAHFMGNFFNKHHGLLNYIYLQYGETHMKIDQIMKTEGDPVIHAWEELKHEPVFYKSLLILYNNYLKKSGGEITDLKPAKIASISEDHIMEIASRFFYMVPLEYTKGERMFKVCISCLDCLKDSTNEISPIIEGFSFFALQTTDEVDIWKDYKTLYKRLKEMKVDDAMSPQEQSKYLNQIIYREMSRNNSLRKALLKKHKELRDILNFDII